jgi:hypothetical protein
VAWIGLKLVISGFHSAEYIGFHVPEWLFWSGMLAIAVLSLLIQPRSKPPDMAESLELLEDEESSDGDGEAPEDGAIDRDHSEAAAQADAVREGSGGQTT